MKAIVCKYIGPTNTRGARVKASAEGVASITVSYDSGLNDGENEAHAARQLCRKNDWNGEMISGGLPNGDTVFVFKG